MLFYKNRLCGLINEFNSHGWNNTSIVFKRWKGLIYSFFSHFPMHSFSNKIRLYKPISIWRKVRFEISLNKFVRIQYLINEKRDQIWVYYLLKYKLKIKTILPYSFFYVLYIPLKFISFLFLKHIFNKSKTIT